MYRFESVNCFVCVLTWFATWNIFLFSFFRCLCVRTVLYGCVGVIVWVISDLSFCLEFYSLNSIIVGRTDFSTASHIDPYHRVNTLSKFSSVCSHTWMLLNGNVMQTNGTKEHTETLLRYSQQMDCVCELSPVCFIVYLSFNACVTPIHSQLPFKNPLPMNLSNRFSLVLCAWPL